MIFDLVKDFSNVLEAMPEEHSRFRILKLLDEAIRRDVHFIDRHPTTFFQCMWNSCWWYDCPEAAQHYETPEGGWHCFPALKQDSRLKLSSVLETWKSEREIKIPHFQWLRSLRPPALPLNAGQLIKFVGHKDSICSVVISPDSRLIATASRDGTARLWDVSTGEVMAVLRQEEASSQIRCASFTANGKCLVLGVDHVVQIWDIASQRCTHIMRGHQFNISALDVSSDGRYIVTGSTDGTIRLWNIDESTEIIAFDSHCFVNSVAFSPDGLSILSGSENGHVDIWEIDLDRKQFNHRIQNQENRQPVYDVCWSHDGQRVAAGFEDGTIRVLHAVLNEVFTLGSTRQEGTWAVCFTPDDKYLASGCGDGAVRLWDLESRICTKTVCRLARTPLSIDIDREGQFIVVATSESAQTWRLDGPDSWIVRTDHQRNSGGGVCLNFNLDGTMLASGAHDGTVRIWDTQTGLQVKVLDSPEKMVWKLTFSKDGRQLISESGFYVKKIRTWDTKTWDQVGSDQHEKRDCNKSVPEQTDSLRSELVLETVLRSNDKEQILGWLADRIWGCVVCPAGLRMAGYVHNELVLVALEGGGRHLIGAVELTD